MPQYCLTDAQRALWKDRLDIYRVSTAVTVDDAGMAANSGQSVTLAYSSVRGRFRLKLDMSVDSAVGRVEGDQLDTVDELRLHSAQEIASGWWVVLRTPGHPLNGQWFQVMGGAAVMQFAAKTQIMLVKKATRPPGVV